MPGTIENTADARSPAAYSVYDGDALERSMRLHRRLRRTIRLVLEVFVFLALAAAFFFRIPGVEGRSMEPTIEGANHVIINTLAYRIGLGPVVLAEHLASRGDVVAFVRDDGDDRKIFLKRIVALPGETVTISSGSVRVNGKTLPEDYGPTADRSNMAALTVPAGSAFVLGDNRALSDDSRVFGAISQSSIVGKALFTIWPLGHIKRIR